MQNDYSCLKGEKGAMNDDRLSKEDLGRLLLAVLEGVADDLRLPMPPAPCEDTDRVGFFPFLRKVLHSSWADRTASQPGLLSRSVTIRHAAHTESRHVTL